ncbi:hypothetical protein Tcan_08119, partial [Toxocara canis]
TLRSQNRPIKLGFAGNLPPNLTRDVPIAAAFKRQSKFILTVQRPRWNEPADYLPEGYDRAPGYSYITALLVQYPGAALGMNIKSYNSKVYITHTDQLSISMQSCLLGDCIVDVQGTPVTTVASCNALIISYLSAKKYVSYLFQLISLNIFLFFRSEICVFAERV